MTPSPTRIDYEKRIFRAMDYISLNIERDLSLEEISCAAAFSPFHFHRIFKAVAGENVAEFARRLRIELAANRLLAYPRESVTEIALSCGFSSSQNFAKAFRQLHTMTPNQYREVKARQAAAPHTGDMPRKAAKAVEIKEMPEATAATIRRIGSYAKICPADFVSAYAGGTCRGRRTSS
jgi:AraC family transcriptional regulator